MLLAELGQDVALTMMEITGVTAATMMLVVTAIMVAAAVLVVVMVTVAKPGFEYGDSPEEMHSHECSKCHFRWSHSGWNRGDKKAHTCAVCGKLEFFRAGELQEAQQRNNPYGLT